MLLRLKRYFSNHPDFGSSLVVGQARISPCDCRTRPNAKDSKFTMTVKNIPPEDRQVKGEKQRRLPVLQGLAEKTSFPFTGGFGVKEAAKTLVFCDTFTAIPRHVGGGNICGM